MIPGLLAFVVAKGALAGTLSVGAGLGAAMDLGDRVSGDYAKFGVGPKLYFPIRWDTDTGVRFRSTLRFETETGSDRVTWAQTIDGEEVRFYDDAHWSMLVAGALTLGAEVGPTSLAFPLRPYGGVEAGLAWVGTFHSFGGDTQILLDETKNDLENARNVDPFTTQWTAVTDLHIGGRRPLGDASTLEVEAGYSSAFLGARTLRKTSADLDARREAYGWNALYLGVAVVVAL